MHEEYLPTDPEETQDNRESKHLKPSVYVGKTAVKPNALLGRIKRAFTNKRMVIFLGLYRSLVYPFMEYTVQAWFPHTKGDIYKLEKI